MEQYAQSQSIGNASNGRDSQHLIQHKLRNNVRFLVAVLTLLCGCLGQAARCAPGTTAHHQARTAAAANTAKQQCQQRVHSVLVSLTRLSSMQRSSSAWFDCKCGHGAGSS